MLSDSYLISKIPVIYCPKYFSNVFRTAWGPVSISFKNPITGSANSVFERSCPNTIEVNIASLVWNGFRHVQTFICLTHSTIRQSANRIPARSSFGLPFGKLSSMTGKSCRWRICLYCGSLNYFLWLYIRINHVNCNVLVCIQYCYLEKSTIPFTTCHRPYSFWAIPV